MLTVYFWKETNDNQHLSHADFARHCFKYFININSFIFYAYPTVGAGLDEAQSGIKIARRNINNLRYADDTTLMAEWRETKEPLDES